MGDWTRHRNPAQAPTRRQTMSKRGRKRRGRKKNAANHGKRPNA
jgi:hypothetical protein